MTPPGVPGVLLLLLSHVSPYLARSSAALCRGEKSMKGVNKACQGWRSKGHLESVNELNFIKLTMDPTLWRHVHEYSLIKPLLTAPALFSRAYHLHCIQKETEVQLRVGT